MSRQLPYPPNVQHLRKEAKALLKTHKSGDSSCCDVLRHLPHLRDRPDAAVLGESVSLTGVQFALAVDYGFSGWDTLMDEVGARLGSDPNNDAVDIRKRFGKSKLVSDHDGIYLNPIPRYPYTAHRIDPDGKTLRHEREGALRCRILGNLFCAMNMTGRSVESFEVATAAGTAFRLGFEPHWEQDIEFVTDIDEFSQACETLGFVGQWSFGKTFQESLAIIEESIESGYPAFVTGWGERFGRLIVGLERSAGQFRSIGGLTFERGIPMPDIGLDEHLPAHMKFGDCPSWPSPESDWFGSVLHPDQVVRNPVFVVKPAKPVPPRERIVRTLENALLMNRSYRIKRINLENRQNAIDNGEPGHDGWKFYFSPWETTFEMGSRALRSCADHIEKMEKPTYDFEMIHGIDTAFGGMLRSRSREVVAWLRSIEPQVASPVRKHLSAAREKFTELARVSNSDMGLVRTHPCYVGAPHHENRLSELDQMITSRPALVYLLSWPEKELVEPRGVEGIGSPWGWRVLPKGEIFEQGKSTASANLRRMAERRDLAFEALEAALKVF